MADGNNNGTSNDTTDVTVVAAPGASTTRMIPRYGLSVYNNDTVQATVYLQLKDGANDRIIERSILEAGESFFNTSFVSLEATDQSLEIYLDAAVTTNQLDFVAKYRDEAQ